MKFFKQNFRILSIFILAVFLTMVGQVKADNQSTAKDLSLKNGKPSLKQPSERVHIMYHPWWGSNKIDSSWFHWSGYNRNPAVGDLGADYYPLLGPYSDHDPKALDQQMEWIAQAGIGVILVTWWGIQDLNVPDAIETFVPGLLKAAQDHGVKVSFIIDAYEGRTPESMANDIRYLIKKFGNHPAFYRTVQPTLHSSTLEPRPVFYIYLSESLSADNPESTTIKPQEWSKHLRALHADPSLGSPPIVLADALNDVNDLDRFCHDFLEVAGFDGSGSYGAFSNSLVLSEHPDFYMRAQQEITKHNALFIAPVGPGFTAKRTLIESTPLDQLEEQVKQATWDRKNGKTYDEMWEKTIESNPWGVSITSWNEWHEGTIIAPVKPFHLSAENNSDRSGAFDYLTFEGHYGLYGEEASMAYILRTRYWVEKLLEISAENKK